MVVSEKIWKSRRLEMGKVEDIVGDVDGDLGRYPIVETLDAKPGHSDSILAGAMRYN